MGIICGAGVAATAAMKQSKGEKNEAENEAEEVNININSPKKKDSEGEDDIPEFEKYSGHKITEVEELLNSVTHLGKYNQMFGGEEYFTISHQNFDAIKEKLNVSEIYLKNNYDPTCTYSFEGYGEMITFRIRDDYCVSNDGFFLINGKWKYFTVDEVREDFIRQHQCKGRTITPDRCYIV